MAPFPSADFVFCQWLFELCLSPRGIRPRAFIRLYCIVKRWGGFVVSPLLYLFLFLKHLRWIFQNSVHAHFPSHDQDIFTEKNPIRFLLLRVKSLIGRCTFRFLDKSGSCIRQLDLVMKHAFTSLEHRHEFYSRAANNNTWCDFKVSRSNHHDGSRP